MEFIHNSGSNHKKILLLEDDPDDVLIFKNFMPVDCSLILTDNRKDAIEAIKRHKPSLCFLDLMLPAGDSGEDVCRSIRNDTDTEISKVPIIITSGKFSRHNRFDRFSSIGADGYLPKPCSAKDVVQQIRKYTAEPPMIHKKPSSRTVLIIDEDPESMHLIKLLVQSSDRGHYRVIASKDCAGGMEIIQKIVPDIVLLSSKSARQDRSFMQDVSKRSAAIVIGDRIDEDFAAHCFRSGVQDCIAKEELDSKTLQRSIRFSLERFFLNRKIIKLSITDDLTGIFNRRGFFMHAKQQMHMQKRRNAPVQFIFADMDRLKSINDDHGHKYGDMAIRQFASILKNTVRKTDVVGRIGGDEFAMMLWNEDAGKDSESVIQRIEDAVNRFNRNGFLPFRLSASMGWISESSRYIRDLEEYINRADKKMYKNKNNSFKLN